MVSLQITISLLPCLISTIAGKAGVISKGRFSFSDIIFSILLLKNLNFNWKFYFMKFTMASQNTGAQLLSFSFLSS
jgi:hypothetical protein